MFKLTIRFREGRRSLRRLAASLAFATAFSASVACARTEPVAGPPEGSFALEKGKPLVMRLDADTGRLSAVPGALAGGKAGPALASLEAVANARAKPEAIAPYAAALSLPMRSGGEASLYVAVNRFGLCRLVAENGSIRVEETEKDPAFASRSVGSFVTLAGIAYCHLYRNGIFETEAPARPVSAFVARDGDGRPVDPRALAFDREYGPEWQVYAVFDTGDGVFAQLRREYDDKADHAFLRAIGTPPFKPEEMEREDFELALTPRNVSGAQSYVREAVAAAAVAGDFLLVIRSESGMQLWWSGEPRDEFAMIHGYLEGDRLWLLSENGTLVSPDGTVASFDAPALGARFGEFVVVDGTLVALWFVRDFPAVPDSGIFALELP